MNELNDSPSPISISEALRDALEPAYKNRWVSEFLFSNLSESPFHSNIPLSPSLFTSDETTITIDCLHTISVTPSILQLQLPECVLKDIPKDGPNAGIDSTLLHTVFIPISTLNSISIGYAFLKHREERPNCMPFNPLIPPITVRFVYNQITNHLLYINLGGTPVRSIGIKSMKIAKHSNFIRNHHSFIVPNAPYQWPNHLPESAVWMLTHTEHLNSPSSSSSDNHIDSNVLGLSSPHLSDGLSPAFHLDATNENNSTTSSTFCKQNRLSTALTLKQFLSGTSGGPSLRIDALDAMTGNLSSMCTGAFSYLHVPTEQHAIQTMKMIFINEYFKDFLAVSCDNTLNSCAQLIQSGTKENTESNTGANEQESNKDEIWRMLLVDTYNGVDNNNTQPSANTQTGEMNKSSYMNSITTSKNDYNNNDIFDLTDISELNSNGNVDDSNIVSDFNFVDNLLSIKPITDTEEIKMSNSNASNSSSQISNEVTPATSNITTSTSTNSNEDQEQQQQQQQKQQPQKSAATEQASSSILPIPSPLPPPHSQSQTIAIAAKPVSIMKQSVLWSTPHQVKTREEILADRKRRNRLSAARSNEKRRLWFVKLEQDVRVGREKIKSLNMTLAQKKRENELLRQKASSLNLVS